MKEGVLKQGYPLESIPVSKQRIISDFNCEEEERHFLENAGVSIGARVMILAREHEGSLLVETNQGGKISLTESLAKKILVTDD